MRSASVAARSWTPTYSGAEAGARRSGWLVVASGCATLARRPPVVEAVAGTRTSARAKNAKPSRSLRTSGGMEGNDGRRANEMGCPRAWFVEGQDSKQARRRRQASTGSNGQPFDELEH